MPTADRRVSVRPVEGSGEQRWPTVAAPCRRSWTTSFRRCPFRQQLTAEVAWRRCSKACTSCARLYPRARFKVPRTALRNIRRLPVNADGKIPGSDPAFFPIEERNRHHRLEWHATIAAAKRRLCVRHSQGDSCWRGKRRLRDRSSTTSQFPADAICRSCARAAGLVLRQLSTIGSMERPSADAKARNRDDWHGEQCASRAGEQFTRYRQLEAGVRRRPAAHGTMPWSMGGARQGRKVASRAMSESGAGAGICTDAERSPERGAVADGVEGSASSGRRQADRVAKRERFTRRQGGKRLR